MTDKQAKLFALTHVLKMQPTFQFYRINYEEVSQEMTVAFNEHKVVWEENGQWWHTDETWTDKCGPFDSEEAANASLQEYCRIFIYPVLRGR